MKLSTTIIASLPGHQTTHPKLTSARGARRLAVRAPSVVLAFSIALFFSNAGATQAQTWQTVDDLSPRSSANTVIADGMGNIYVAGSTPDASGYPAAVVLKSSDGGATWDADPNTPEEEASLAARDFGTAEFRALASARRIISGGLSQDHLIVAGKARHVLTASGSQMPWDIRRSLDYGVTWQSLPDFFSPYGITTVIADGPHAVSMDNDGIIYVAGAARETIKTVTRKGTTYSYVLHWIVIKSNGTLPWQVIADFRFPPKDAKNLWNCKPSSIHCVGNDVFVTGGGGVDGLQWLVYKTSNGGSTWTVVDRFHLGSPDFPSHALGVAADSAGNLYVAGKGGRTVSGLRADAWIVRKGTAGGTVWTTVDQFQGSYAFATANGIAIDQNDNIYVTGAAFPSAYSRWITRQYSASSGWQTTDDYVHPTTAGATGGLGITTDPFRNIFAAGRTIAGAPTGAPQNWIVRRKLAP